MRVRSHHMSLVSTMPGMYFSNDLQKPLAVRHIENRVLELDGKGTFQSLIIF